MTMLVTRLRTALTEAIRHKDELHKNVLRYAIGEIERSPKDPEKVLRSTVDKLRDTVQYQPEAAALEIAILEGFLPKLLTLEELEAEFLNSDGPEFEQIQNCKGEGQAIGIAMRFVRQLGLQVASETVTMLVKKIRSQE
jgi:hypothetical protein